MVIYGKTDREVVLCSPLMVDVRVFVGTKKRKNGAGKEIFGKDLITHFRVEAKNPAVAKSLERLRMLGEVKTLPIILAFDDPDKAYSTKMVRYSRGNDELSGCLSECDRRTIYRKKIAVKDPFGGKRGVVVENDEPCPMAGKPIHEECSKGCSSEGTLYFYIPALLDKGRNALCSLVVSGEFNMRHISKALYKLKDDYQTIKTISNSPSTYNAILLDLGRVTKELPHPVFHGKVRTGKTKLKPTPLIDLQVNEEWLQYYRNTQRVSQVRELGYNPSAELVASIVGEEYFELPGTTQDMPSLPGSPKAVEEEGDCVPIYEVEIVEAWTMTKERNLELQEIWRREKWTKSALEECLFSYFDIESLGGLKNLEEEQFESLKGILGNLQCKQEFGLCKN